MRQGLAPRRRAIALPSRRMTESLSRRAPAKVNLALAVGPPDPASGDHRHPICSWMAPVSLCDDLTVVRLPPGSLSRYGLFWAEDARHKPEINWPILKDLAVRAHLLLREAVGRDLPLQMKIEKRIPLGAGLGGGSSDAAAMLLACNDLFDLRLPAAQLVQLAASLGSDVPFFIAGRCAVIEGFGERLAEVSDPGDLHLVLCLPPYGCATAEVYRLFDRRGATPAGFETAAGRVRAMAREGRVGSSDPFNDLAQAAFDHQPQLARLAAALAELAERPVHVTGSGSTLFVACGDEMEADALASAASERLGTPALAVGLEKPAAAASPARAPGSTGRARRRTGA